MAWLCNLLLLLIQGSPWKGVRRGHTARPSLLTTPLELRRGAGIWTLQELTAPTLSPEPNVQDACFLFFVKFQLARLPQRSLLGAVPLMLAPTWLLASTLSELSSPKMPCL